MLKFWLSIFILISSAAVAQAEDFVLTVKDHTFSPDPLTVPAGQKVKLVVKNVQSTNAEFESSDLNREKVVEAGSEIIVYIGPLDPGKYTYFDDFHRETTATIIVK
jgi:plastocyanin